MSRKTLKIPKDLGLKMGSKEMVLWTQVIKETKAMIEQAENNLIVQRTMLKAAELQLVVEKAKFEKV